MRPFSSKRRDGAPGGLAGILVRLRRDTRGNVLAMVAAWLIPLAAFSGSAIDMGRLYAVKIRLQQACDSGVLAGRKSMTGSTLDTSDSGQAQTFFYNNFQYDKAKKTGWYQSTAVSFTPKREDDSSVSGTASATVPMAVMAMFGQPNKTITVTCQARYDVADTDVMFVLDTTGSMACNAANDCSPSVSSYTREDGTTGYYDVEQGGSKISGLRSAVLSFFDTVASSADSSTHIRYGFVPYTSTVNVGAAITGVSSAYMVGKWQYQTRRVTGDVKDPDVADQTLSGTTDKPTCDLYNTYRSPAAVAAQPYTYSSNGTAKKVISTSYNASASRCTLVLRTVIPVWTYDQAPWDVSGYVASLGSGASVRDPSKIWDGSNAPFYTSKWQGCIEERQTTASSSFDVNNLPPDLDPDLAPAASVDSNGVPTASDTRWRPMWPDVIYYRNTAGESYTGQGNSPYGDTTSTSAQDPYTSVAIASTMSSGYVSCGKKAQRLQTMTRDQVSAYVNSTDFKAIGGTYHDTGMIWGTRMISPNGIFAGDTAAWPGRQAPNRYIVFMTDGEMSPNAAIYGMYGMEQYDKRVTGNNYSGTNDLNYHNARFVAECQAAKARNITVFVVGFGQTLNDQLKACASPGQAYYASDNASLTAAFQKIAQQVAMLRISK